MFKERNGQPRPQGFFAELLNSDATAVDSSVAFRSGVPACAGWWIGRMGKKERGGSSTTTARYKSTGIRGERR